MLDRLAAAALVPDFLAQERVILSAAGRRRLLAALVQELMAANALLVRRAKGDYSPDPRPARFPEWKAPAATAELSPMGLYQAWSKANEARTSISTRNRWISVFRDLERFWDGKDVSLLTEKDAIQWRDELRAGSDKPGGRTDKTVNFQYIAAFTDAESYYATLGHECVHWTRHASRLDRDFGQKRFGVEPYAREELVAELGAAFLCADLGIACEDRDDHAAYIAHWLQALKDDKRCIFAAAAHAQRAVDYLKAKQPAVAEAGSDAELIADAAA